MVFIFIGDIVLTDFLQCGIYKQCELVLECEIFGCNVLEKYSSIAVYYHFSGRAVGQIYDVHRNLR